MAIAILFLFVVMMLNVKVAETHVNPFQYFPLGGFFLMVLFLDIGSVAVEAFPVSMSEVVPIYSEWPKEVITFGSLESLGFVLYTYFFLYLFEAGILLLLAMIGAILLTLHRGVGVRRQDVAQQNRRDWISVLQRVVLCDLTCLL